VKAALSTPASRVLLVLWLAVAAVGIWGVVERLVGGHTGAGYGSYVPWGLWVAMYFHLVGLAGGTFVLGALGFMFRWKGFERLATLRTTIVLSIALILPAFIGVWLDLGRLGRAYRIFASPSFTSMMAFNAWMYTGFIVVALVTLWLTYRKRSSWLRPVLALGILLSIAFPSQSGAFFGVIDAKPYWHSALLPFLFLASAIVAGAALLLVVRYLQGRYEFTAWDQGATDNWEAAVGRLRMVTLVGIIVYLVLEFAEISIGFWSPVADAPGLELMLWGNYWWVFWIVHILFGALIPIVLLATRRKVLWMAAGALTAVAFVSARLNILIPGQTLSEIEGLNEAFYHERLVFDYKATWEEYLVALFLVAAAATFYYLGVYATAAISERRRKQGGAS
jgi:molybdopterin-containing oxidoreductase family membrane subunit